MHTSQLLTLLGRLDSENAALAHKVSETSAAHAALQDASQLLKKELEQAQALNQQLRTQLLASVQEVAQLKEQVLKIQSEKEQDERRASNTQCTLDCMTSAVAEINSYLRSVHAAHAAVPANSFSSTTDISSLWKNVQALVAMLDAANDSSKSLSSTLALENTQLRQEVQSLSAVQDTVESQLLSLKNEVYAKDHALKEAQQKLQQTSAQLKARNAELGMQNVSIERSIILDDDQDLYAELQQVRAAFADAEKRAAVVAQENQELRSKVRRAQLTNEKLVKQLVGQPKESVRSLHQLKLQLQKLVGTPSTSAPDSPREDQPLLKVKAYVEAIATAFLRDTRQAGAGFCLQVSAFKSLEKQLASLVAFVQESIEVECGKPS